MKTIPATNFKTHCLSLLAHVARSQQPLLVTRHGKPLVKVAPVSKKIAVHQKPLKGSVVYWGDVLSPLMNFDNQKRQHSKRPHNVIQ